MRIGFYSLMGKAIAIIIAILLVAPVYARCSESKETTILFFGDSLTAGFGVDPASSYPSLVADLAKKAAFKVRVLNAGVSGDTTASGVRRLAWVLQQRPDIFFLALGANDGLRGIDPEETKRNLKTIIQEVRVKYPDTVIVMAGMLMPPNYGPEYTAKFKAIFLQVAEEEKTPLLSFLLEKVAGNPSLNQPDRLHPNEKGHEAMSAEVWSFLKPTLSKLAGPPPQ